MKIDHVLAIVLRQFYLLRSSPSRVLALFAWAAVDIVLWGFITRYLNGITSGLHFVSTLLGAVLLWDLLTRVMHGVTTAFFEDIWSRNFLNLFATPLNITEYLLGLVISGIATSAVGLFVMLLLATTAFGLSFLFYGLVLMPFLLVLFITGIALGIFGSAIVLRFGPATEWFVWPIPALLSPFACVFYPLSTLPHWMQMVAFVLPPSYVFEAMRAIANGSDAVSINGMLIGVILAIGYLLLSCWFFTRIFRYAVRGGLIARYSAETVS